MAVACWRASRCWHWPAGPPWGLPAPAYMAEGVAVLAAGALLGAALVADGVLLQVGERSAAERVAMGLLATGGLALGGRIGRVPGAAAALLIGLSVVAIELATLTVTSVPR